MVRDKDRYLLVNGDVEATLKALREEFGRVGLVQASPVVVWREDKFQVVRVKSAGIKKFRAANLFTKNEIILVSGSLLKLKKAMEGKPSSRFISHTKEKTGMKTPSHG